MAKRVCVIGGGVSGISAVKSLVEEGLKPTCFESRGDIVLSAESPKHLSENSSALLFKNIHPYPSGAQLQTYLKNYVHHFELEKYFQFEKEVVTIEEQNVKSDGLNRWRVTVKDTRTSELITEEYDCGVICSGTFIKPTWPRFSGLNSHEFNGRIMHSCEYQSEDNFEGKDVLVVGLGSSGCDIAAEISCKSNRTVLSTRSGAYLLPRIYKKGLPPDMIVTSRAKIFMRDIAPTGFADWASRRVFGKFDLRTLGIESKYSPSNPVAVYVISDELAYRIFSGKVVVKPDVVKATADEVYFEDGSKEKIDVVIFATGYSTKFPFISDSILPDKIADAKLFEWMFPFILSDPSSLAVAGVIPFNGGASIPRYECQTRYIAQVMAGVTSLPPLNEMRKAFEKDRKNYTQFSHLGRPFVFKDQIGFKYPDRIAKMAGFYPSFWGLFFQDPRLALAVYFGPFLSYHYRIFGRHSKREFARDRTLNAIKNTLSAFTRTDN